MENKDYNIFFYTGLAAFGNIAFTLLGLNLSLPVICSLWQVLLILYLRQVNLHLHL